MNKATKGKMRALLVTAIIGSVLLVSQQANAEDAKALAQKYGCFACHATDESIIGPSFKAIATKYKGNAGAKSALISKIKFGVKAGEGIWGAKPQPKYKDEIKNEQDYAVLIDWVLSQ